MKEQLKKWAAPPNASRPIPFWSWNDTLETDVLREQIDEMSGVGVGGYFMHARSGIETEYLSEDWFACISAGLEQGEKTGLDSWIYDEAGWPSGFAGGEVTAKGDKFHARGLKLLKLSDEEITEKNLLGVYSYDAAANAFSPAESAKDAQYAVCHASCPYYIDILNSEVTAEFLRCTHERYYARYGEKFGKSLKGFFTDEPRLSEGDIPWSYILPDEFKKRCGYDILPNLPLLFIPAKGYEKVRFDFWNVVSDLFVKSFMKQIYDWCTAHNCQLTGHVMMEETLYSQMTGTAGSMPFYEFMHMPGVDWLRRTMENPVVSKQVGSAAEQLGKKYVLTESYALTGWDVSFEELKWIAEWQYVNGVNVMCQHLQGYSLRGMRKRDYPPSLFFQQTWWNEYRTFNDYLARLGNLLTEGEKEADVLLLHPMQSGWVAYDGTNNPTLKKLDADFAEAVNTLSGIHCDYHLGDETILSNYGKTAGGTLRVGNGTYRAAVLPSMLTIHFDTLKLLEDFLTGGGTVISVGDFPKLCDGKESPRLAELEKKVLKIRDKKALAETLKPLLQTPLTIIENGTEVEDIRYCLRSTEGRKILFLANQSKTAFHRPSLTVKGSWQVTKIALETMEPTLLGTLLENNKTTFDLDFAPMQSHILVLEPTEASVKKPCEKTVALSLKGKTWDIEKADLNSLTLDTCTYRIDGGEWQPPIAVIHLMQKLLEMKQSCSIEMNFTFELETEPDSLTECFAAIEQLRRFKLAVNGNSVAYKDIGWWKDTSFEKADIRPYLHRGINTITLSGTFFQSQKVYDVLFGENVYETELNKLTYDTELESIYLVGDFGVVSKTPYTERERYGITTTGGFVLTKRPTVLQGGDFTRQGLCFFAGKLTVGTTLTVRKESDSRILLDFGRPRCTLFKVFVNGKPVRTVLWAPFQIDVTDFLKDGENRITVELFASNRNLLGPHHHINGEIYNVGTESFAGRWSWVERPTEGVEANPEDMKKNYWTDSYTFVTFGLE